MRNGAVFEKEVLAEVSRGQHSDPTQQDPQAPVSRGHGPRQAGGQRPAGAVRAVPVL